MWSYHSAWSSPLAHDVTYSWRHSPMTSQMWQLWPTHDYKLLPWNPICEQDNFSQFCSSSSCTIVMQIKIILKRAIAWTVYNLINAAIRWKKGKKISWKQQRMLCMLNGTQHYWIRLSRKWKCQMILKSKWFIACVCSGFLLWKSGEGTWIDYKCQFVGVTDDQYQQY